MSHLLPEVKLSSSTEVNATDYYSDLLLLSIIPWLKQKEEDGWIPKRVLEIGTGRGYIPIVLALLFPEIDQIIATDIDDNAISLAEHNVALNQQSDRIIVRSGNLFQPVKGEKFDLILTVPPQLPLTPEQIEQVLGTHESYHLTTSSGGERGRDYLDQIITEASDFLSQWGVIAISQSDMSSFVLSQQLLKQHNFVPMIIGELRKSVSETTLTRLAKNLIEEKGYVFQKDEQGEPFFTVGVILGQLLEE